MPTSLTPDHIRTVLRTWYTHVRTQPVPLRAALPLACATHPAADYVLRHAKGLLFIECVSCGDMLQMLILPEYLEPPGRGDGTLTVLLPQDLATWAQAHPEGVTALLTRALETERTRLPVDALEARSAAGREP